MGYFLSVKRIQNYFISRLKCILKQPLYCENFFSRGRIWRILLVTRTNEKKDSDDAEIKLNKYSICV